MESPLPIKFTELVQLTQLGILPSSIGFNTCTLESDNFICVRQKVDSAASPEVLIVELKNSNNVIRKPIKADSAILHWNKRIIALKAQQRTLQIFDIDQKAKLKSAIMTEDVLFWKWISEKCLALVTDCAVYQWDIYDPNAHQPTKIFDRNEKLSNTQIINLRCSTDQMWYVLVGISQQQSRVVGSMQLYSKARGVSQLIEGHAAAFGSIRIDDSPSDTKLFSFCVRTATGASLHIVEIDQQAGRPDFPKKNVDFYFPPEATHDFPVSMQISSKYSIIYVLTKYGFIHLYDLETGTCIFMNRISNDTVFVSCADSESAGILAINRQGQVLHVTIDESSIIPYLLKNPANGTLLFKLASRADLSGADSLFEQRFEECFSNGQYVEAAKIAARSPRGFLRTAKTIERLKQCPAQTGQISTILQYFGILLDKGSLNKYETIELVRPVLSQNRKALLEKWLKEDKLYCSEELGDMVRVVDLNLALQIYQTAKVPQKVVAAFADLGQFDSILPYSKEMGYKPDFTVLLHHVVRVNPEKGSDFATALVKDPSGPLIDISRVMDIFQSQGMIQQATAFLLDILAPNLPEQGPLQTKLLEMNLLQAPQVADAILGNDMFSYYDRERIAQLCENAGLFSRALDHTDDPTSIKRMIVKSDKFTEDWLLNYFGRLTVDLTFECLNEMLEVDLRQNLAVVIRIAQKYSDLLGANRIIELFEKFKTWEGLYYYLGMIINISEDEDVHFKYIESATRMQQFSEVERICRESNFYNPDKVKNFLKESNLSDPLPLIVVCDRFNFVNDLVLFLYKKENFKAIEIYIQRVNPARSPMVIGALLDIDCDEQIIKSLLGMINADSVSIDELVSELESRNRLKLLLPFLDRCLDHGIRNTAIFNALAKIQIDSNNNATSFLKENDDYDTLTIGKYCEKRNPDLAYIAFNKGKNDIELINLTNENSMFKAQARYLVDRADHNIWVYALNPNSVHRRSLVDQVISTAIPESKDPNKVSVAVKAFITMDMPSELIDLLERIILEPSTFSDNSTLQNLLMLTAAKSDRARLQGYIHQLSAYSSEDIAQQCIDLGMFEEAFDIYDKFKDHVSATKVLVEHIMSIDRAQEYADKVDVQEVWSIVGKAQLDGLRISDSIESYIKASDPSNHGEVIEIASRAGKDEELVKYLRMARRNLRESSIDTGLAFCYARLGLLSELQDFLQSSNLTNADRSGDKAYDEKLYEAAKIFYSSVSNWGKLATTLVHLGDYQGAVDATRKANSVRVWREVHKVCIAKNEFRLAEICGLNLIIHAEELKNVVFLYEKDGYYDELMELLSNGLGLEQVHMGIFTELGIAYVKYAPEKVIDHIRLYFSRINIPRMIRACDEAMMWPELVFLYVHYDEWDNATLTMIEHSETAWEHGAFKDTITKVSNLEIYYRALNFYLQKQPSLLTDLLQVLTPRIDVNRVVRIFTKSDNIPLIKRFLLSVQGLNKKSVNEALNTLLVEEEDYKTLAISVESFDNFDTQELASKLESHDLIFFRQIAAKLWRKCRRWEKSISVSKQDRMYKDAIETASLSTQPAIVEDLLRYFVEIGQRECFVAMLFTCYDLVRPDLAIELAWRHGLYNFTMPFMISILAQKVATINALEKERAERMTASNKPEEPILANGNRLLITHATSGFTSQTPVKHTFLP